MFNKDFYDHLLHYFLDCKTAWLGLNDSREQYSLRYESKHLRQLGQALDLIVDAGVQLTITEALKHTLLAGMGYVLRVTKH